MEMSLGNMVLAIMVACILFVVIVRQKDPHIMHASGLLIKRNDGSSSKPIAIESLNIYNTYGDEVQISEFEGGSAHSTTLNDGPFETNSGAVKVDFNGKDKRYMSFVEAKDPNSKHPVVAALRGAESGSGSMYFFFSKPTHIGKVVIRPPNDDNLKNFMSNVSIQLITENKEAIPKTHAIIPYYKTANSSFGVDYH